jgi:hypothetical protein
MGDGVLIYFGPATAAAGIANAAMTDVRAALEAKRNMLFSC